MTPFRRDLPPIRGMDFWRSEEFKALAKALSLDITELPTTDVVIKIPLDGVVEIVQTYQARGKPTSLAIETTTFDNREYRTHVPKWDGERPTLKIEQQPTTNEIGLPRIGAPYRADARGD